MFFSSLLAATTVQLSIIGVLLMYLMFVLKISFGGRLGYIALICVIATTTGVTLGTFISSVVKGSEGIKIGILIGAINILSFLSGMMYDKMKYIVNTKLPVAGYLNPANLIADSFFSLYYYDSYAKFYTNILLLCGFIIIFSFSTYLVLRRQKYASL
jgi:ABC-2 type transport system permease protein